MAILYLVGQCFPDTSGKLFRYFDANAMQAKDLWIGSRFGGSLSGHTAKTGNERQKGAQPRDVTALEVHTAFPRQPRDTKIQGFGVFWYCMKEGSEEVITRD